MERWQSERENKARILLSESGVEPLTLEELIGYGAEISLDKIVIGYGWTKGSPTLRHMVSEFLDGISPENILITSGSSEANFLAVLTIVRPGDNVIVDMPNYMQIPGLLSWRGAEVYEAWRSPNNSWKIPVVDILEAIKKVKPRAIFLTVPNNPTGAIDYDSLAEIASELKITHTILVIDEVYRGLEIHQEISKSAITLGVEYGVPVVVTGGLSKVFGLPGLRIGWIASNIKGIIDSAWANKDYTTISPPRISEVIATQALRREVRDRLIERAKTIVKRNIEILKEIIYNKKELLEPWWPLAGSFLLARVPWVRDTMKLAETLFNKYGILVVPGECFELPGTVRIGLGRRDPNIAREEFLELLNALENIKK